MKLTPFNASTYFLKKKLSYHFFTKIEISNVCFSLFSYFRNFFFKLDAYQLEELSLVHLLAVTRKQFTSYFGSMHFFKKKNSLSRSRLQILVFRFFSCFRDFFSNLTFISLSNSLLHIFWLQQEIFLHPLEQANIFLTK